MGIVGVDGCPGGWVAVAWDTERGVLTPSFHPTFADIVTSHADAACVAIDIPIGLRDDGRPRSCDLAARALLGHPRRASVFPAPQRRLLDCATHAEASSLSRRAFGYGVSIQAFGIYRKIRDVDRMMTPALHQRVIEVHPEVSLWAMAEGKPAGFSKKRLAGFEERRVLLVGGLSMPDDLPSTRGEARRLAPFAGPDDLLDAIAAAWTARRHAEGRASRIPVEPEIDERSLRMEIVY
jgi:predicted RNase H-like nuclease